MHFSFLLSSLSGSNIWLWDRSCSLSHYLRCTLLCHLNYIRNRMCSNELVHDLLSLSMISLILLPSLIFFGLNIRLLQMSLIFLLLSLLYLIINLLSLLIQFLPSLSSLFISDESFLPFLLNLHVNFSLLFLQGSGKIFSFSFLCLFPFFFNFLLICCLDLFYLLL